MTRKLIMSGTANAARFGSGMYKRLGEDWADGSSSSSFEQTLNSETDSVAYISCSSLGFC